MIAQMTDSNKRPAMSGTSLALAKLRKEGVDHVNIVQSEGVTNVLSLASPCTYVPDVDNDAIFGGFGTIEGLLMFIRQRRTNSNNYLKPMGLAAADVLNPVERALAIVLVHRRVLKIRDEWPTLIAVAERSIVAYTTGRFNVRKAYPAMVEMPTYLRFYIAALKADMLTGDGNNNVAKLVEAILHSKVVDDPSLTGDMSGLYESLGFQADIDPETFEVVEKQP